MGDAYSDLLRAALERSGMSRRRFSALLAAESGNTRESEYRSIGKYLGGEVPLPPRAAVLAVLLGAPELAMVPDGATRRGGRLAELEARVAELEELANRGFPRLEQLVDRVEALEKPARSRRAPSSRAR